MSEKLSQVTDSNFDQVVLKSDKPVMVDFFSEHCGPCKMAMPIVEKLSEELRDQVRIVSYSVMDNSDRWQEYEIKGVPHFIMFKGGEIVRRWIGFRPIDKMREEIRLGLESPQGQPQS